MARTFEKLTVYWRQRLKLTIAMPETVLGNGWIDLSMQAETLLRKGLLDLKSYLLVPGVWYVDGVKL